jgi:hypothetical protein
MKFARWYGYALYGLIALIAGPAFLLFLAVGWAAVLGFMFVALIPAFVATPFLLRKRGGRATLDRLYGLEFLQEEGPFCEMYWRYYTPGIMIVTRVRDGERIGIEGGIWIWEDKNGLFTIEFSMKDAFSLEDWQKQSLISDWQEGAFGRDNRNPHTR